MTFLLVGGPCDEGNLGAGERLASAIPYYWTEYVHLGQTAPRTALYRTLQVTYRFGDI